MLVSPADNTSVREAASPLRPCSALYTGLCCAVAILVVSIVEFHAEFSPLVASFGASAMILYGHSQMPAAQPKNVIGGQMLSALIGVSWQKIWHHVGLHYPPLLNAIAVFCTTFAMSITKCSHPPGVATALLATAGPASVKDLGFMFILHPVGSGISLMVVLALLVNNLSKDRRYPTFWY